MALLDGKQLRDASLSLTKVDNSGSQGSILFGSGTTIGVTDSPTLNTDLTNKSYVDSVAAGLDPKESVLVATSADLGATYSSSSGVGGSGQFTGAPTTIDTIALSEGDRVLVKNQSDARENGIYVVTATTTVWDRASDMDGTPANEISTGNSTHVSAGSNWQASGWVVGPDNGTNGILTLNVNNINWFQFSAASQFTFDNGLTQTGNNIQLGGSLVENTDIDGATNTYNFTYTDLNDFSVGAANNNTLTMNTSGTVVTGGNANNNITLNSTSVQLNDSNTNQILMNATGLSLTDSVNTNSVVLNSSGVLITDTSGSTIQMVSNAVNIDAPNSISLGANIDTVNILLDSSSAGGSGIQITDSDNTKGMYYSADYSTNGILSHGNRWIPDKGYVDLAIANNVAAIGATNGLTEYSAGTIGLGGTLNQNTTISGATGTYNLTINDINALTLATNSGYSLVMNGSATFTDTAGSAGLVYAADYSANFTDRSLIDKAYADSLVTTQTTNDKNITASVTTSDGDTTGATITTTPANDGYVEVLVNGLQQVLGDGVKTTDCYFSGDGGTTARAISAITATDILYWNGSIAGYQLAATDIIDLNYEV